MATTPGDIVLDCFAGSGTTAAAAHKMGRRWVTMEVLPQTAKDFIAPRLTSVVDGTDSGGITPLVGWGGGGGFTQVTIEDSLYEVVSDDLVLIRDVDDETLARSAAAQLGFTYAPDHPFRGVRGQMRLVAVNGTVGPEEARFFASHLRPGERLALVATSVLPGVEEAVAAAARGSVTLKAPRDLLTSATRRMTRRAPQVVPNPATEQGNPQEATQ